MAIKIYSQVFILIHDELYDRFKKLGDPNSSMRFRANSREPWELNYFGTSTKIYPDVFNGKTYPWYWNEKYSTHKNSKIGFREEPSGTIIEALNFLGTELPQEIRSQVGRDGDLEAKILMQLYLENHVKGSEILAKYDEIIVFDTMANTLLKKNTNEMPSATVVDERTTTQIDEESVEIDLVKLEQLVERYCNYVGDKDIDMWSLFTPTYKADWESSIHNFLSAVNRIQEIRNPVVFGLAETISQRRSYEMKEVDKHVSFKVFYTQIIHPTKTKSYNDYWACVNKEMSVSNRIEYYREQILMEHKINNVTCEVEGEYLRTKFEFDEYFIDEPKFLSHSYTNEELYLDVLQKEFDRFDKFKNWFTLNQLPFDNTPVVAYDKLDWWDCVLSNGEWLIDNIEQYALNKPYPHIRFGRPIYKKL